MPSTSSEARSGISRRSARSRSRSVRPSTNSMTMYGTGVLSIMSSPVSYTAMIDGWLSEAADCASRRKRAWNVWSLARSERSVLMATTRSSRMSRAR